MTGLAAMALTAILAATGTRPEPVAASKERQGMVIRITVGDAVLRATLTDSKASRDFASLLPLTLTRETCSAGRSTPTCRG